MSISSKTPMNLSKVLTVGISTFLLTADPVFGHTDIGDGQLPIPEDIAPSKEAPSNEASAFSLIGTEWQATEIEGKPLVPTERGDITLFFGSEILSGFAGCNGFFSEWEELLDSKPAMFSTPGSIGRNRVFCGNAIMDQEDTFLGALQGITAYSVSDDGDVLTVYATATATGEDGNSEEAPHSLLHVGRPLVRFTRISTMDDIPDDEDDNDTHADFGGEVWDEDDEAEDEVDNSIFFLEDSSWQLAEVRGFQAVDDGSRPITLSFNSDTSVSGFDGCNSFRGPMDMLFGIDTLPSFRISKPLIVTRARCRDPMLAKQASMFRGVLSSDPVIYNIIKTGKIVELKLYAAAEADNNGRQTQGELLARFTRVDDEF